MAADCFSFSVVPGGRRQRTRRLAACSALASSQASPRASVLYSLGAQAFDDARLLELQVAQARIAELEAELHGLRDQVCRDALTGTLNRRGLQDAYLRETARQQRHGAPLAVALLDLDDFKRLNDCCGHAAGDAALVTLAWLLGAALRPSDVLCRLGGEEFVLLLPDTTLDDARRTLERLLQACLEVPSPAGGGMSFSAGVTLLAPGDTLDSVLARADAATYRAKAAGKRRIELVPIPHA